MSKNNKVNKDHYVQRGRLTADESARERQKQTERTGPSSVRNQERPMRAGRDASRPRSAPEE
jgi:hypothetical protein